MRSRRIVGLSVLFAAWLVCAVSLEAETNPNRAPVATGCPIIQRTRS